jgi:hypothetical protein
VKKKHYLVILLALCIFSCKKLLEKPSWNTHVTAPLITSKLSLSNIIKDSVFHKNADSSITIVENKLLYSFGLDSLVKLSVKPYTKSVKLSSLKLDSQVIIRNITLGQIANQLIASGNFTNMLIGNAINGNNKNTTPFCIPSFTGISAGPFPIDISAYFQTATMLTGTMSVTVTNNLPLTISSLDYDIKNHKAGTIVFADVLSNLTPGTSKTDTVNLKGKTVEGKLDTKINNMDVTGACVFIDTSKAIQVKIKISNITVSSATAIFPTQDVIYDSSRVSLVGMKDVELTYAKLKTGTVTIDAYSTASDTIFFTYGIPSAKKNGQPFVTNTKVPPAVGGVSSHVTFPYDFADYDLNLQGYNNDTINTLYNTIRGKIKYSGILESFSLQDSVYVVISFNNIQPSYVKGFLGRDTLNIGPSSISLDVFKNIESGTLNFEKVKAFIIVKNGVGVDGEVKINTITATNTKTGISQTLTGPVVGIAKPITAATDIPAMQTATQAIDSINLGTGSNMTSLLGVLPDKITYQAQVIYNPAGKPASYSSYKDFAYSNVTLEPYLELEVPLSLIASDLVLSDTVNFNGKDKESTIKNGDFNILVENGFPLNADLKLYFLSSAGTILDSMVSTNSIKAATIAGGPRVTGPMYSKIPFHLDQSKLNNILHAYKIVFKVKFSTAALPGNFVKIYSDYSIDFKLTGSFDYLVK